MEFWADRKHGILKSDFQEKKVFPEHAEINNKIMKQEDHYGNKNS